jgi:GST-like protein
MIRLHAWHTPNGRKVSVMLEEVSLPYEIVKVNLAKREQFTPEFTRISPNQKIPAIEDDEGPGGRPIALAESGAILLYLAEKTGKLIPAEPHARYSCLQWLMFQMAHIGPMLGQAHHFRLQAKEKLPYAIERYEKEAARLYGVMEARLAAAPYLAGAEYSIADVCTYPWILRYFNFGVALDDYPAVKRWTDTIGARPAVARGMEVLKPLS